MNKCNGYETLEQNCPDCVHLTHLNMRPRTTKSGRPGGRHSGDYSSREHLLRTGGMECHRQGSGYHPRSPGTRFMDRPGGHTGEGCRCGPRRSVGGVQVRCKMAAETCH